MSHNTGEPRGAYIRDVINSIGDADLARPELSVADGIRTLDPRVTRQQPNQLSHHNMNKDAHSTISLFRLMLHVGEFLCTVTSQFARYSNPNCHDSPKSYL